MHPGRAGDQQIHRDKSDEGEKCGGDQERKRIQSVYAKQEIRKQERGQRRQPQIKNNSDKQRPRPLPNEQQDDAGVLRAYGEGVQIYAFGVEWAL